MVEARRIWYWSGAASLMGVTVFALVYLLYGGKG